MKSAQKILIHQILTGDRIQDEKGLRVKTKIGEISEVRIMGRITEVFTNNENSYGFLKIDDETGAIQSRFIEKELRLMKKAKIGDLVELVGRLRTFKDIIYIVCDGFSILENINWALLRKLEVGMTEENGPKEEILRFIKDKKTVEVEEIQKKWKEGQKHIDDLKFDGEIYEPKSGILQLVE